MKPEMWEKIYPILDRYQISTIVETGTHHGQGAVQFINHLIKKTKNISYTGYDLFEQATHSHEKNGKGVGDYNRAVNSLNAIKSIYKDRFEFNLVKGDTKKTLTSPVKSDFAFIDGGHTYETVMHDFSMLKECKVILFDDYQIKGVKDAVDEIIKKHPNFQPIFIEHSGNKRKHVFLIQSG